MLVIMSIFAFKLFSNLSIFDSILLSKVSIFLSMTSSLRLISEYTFSSSISNFLPWIITDLRAYATSGKNTRPIISSITFIVSNTSPLNIKLSFKRLSSQGCNIIQKNFTPSWFSLCTHLELAVGYRHGKPIRPEQSAMD